MWTLPLIAFLPYLLKAHFKNVLLVDACPLLCHFEGDLIWFDTQAA